MITGNDIFIDKNVNIKRKELVSMGDHIAIDYGFHCTTGLSLGDYIHIGPHVSCIGGPSGRFIAKGFNNIMAGARIICGSDRFDDSGLFGALIPKELQGRQVIEPIIMEEFSNIGTNAIIMPGTRLRKGVLVTAGSLIMGDTEEWGVYKGNPAKLIKKIDSSKILENASKMGYRDFHLNGCFCDPLKKFTFIHIFKNASISIRDSLNMRGNYYNWDTAKHFENSKTICVIRNPINRFISAYQYLLKLDDGGFPNRHPIEITRASEFYKNRKNPVESFYLFLDFIEKERFYDAVTIPQTTFLRERSLLINDIDNVFIQEQLESDYSDFREKHGIRTRLQKNNTGNSEITKLLINLVESDKGLKERISKLYKSDMELYFKLTEREE